MSGSVQAVVVVTQEEYDALTEKDPTVLYAIEE